MKLFTSAALAAALSTTAIYANTLEDTNVTIMMTAGALDVTVDGARDGATNLEFGVSVFEHSFSNIGADVRLAFGTNLNTSDDLYGRVEYNLITEGPAGLTIYGSAAVQYDTNTRFNTFDWAFDPSVGASYDLGVAGVYAEVGYTWALDGNYTDLGGYVEVGVPFNLASNISVTPSVSRTIGSGANETTANLGLAFNF
jgi:hypothetical protein